MVGQYMQIHEWKMLLDRNKDKRTVYDGEAAPDGEAANFLST